MNHTPGPLLREGNTIYALMHAGWRKGVEQFRNRFSAYVQADKDCDDEEHEANARIIAAAPDLLEACQAAEWNSLDLPEFVREKLVAAIAKATNA